MTFADRLMADPFDLARALARRHNLVCNDGSIVCWDCKRVESLLPSLHCPRCLADAWQRLRITDPQCEQREQTDEDRSLMARKTGETNGS